MNARLVLPVFAAALGFIPAHAATFSYLDPAYTQSVYAVSAGRLTSFAFAPNGDVWAVQESPNALVRFDSHATQIVNGTEVHPIVATVPLLGAPGPSPYSGITNHQDGHLYLDGSGFVAMADANSGAILSVTPWGACGGGLQLASDLVVTGQISTVGMGNVFDVEPGVLACVMSWGLPDIMNESDLVFDPVSHTEFVALNLKVSDFPSEIWKGYVGHVGPGVLEMVAPLPASPTGIALWDGLRQAVVAIEDGTLQQADLVGADQNHPATPVLLASGGFVPALGTGNIVRKGPDGALYVLQNGTRYDDGSQGGEYSIVRIASRTVPVQATTWGRIKGEYRGAVR